MRRHFIKLELNKNFLHNKYVRAATRAALAKTDDNQLNDKLDVPNPPHTPQIKSMKLKYTASSNLVDPNTTTFNQYQNKEIQLFHIGIFGEAEQHGFLKNQLAFLEDSSVTLINNQTNQGNLIFSLANLKAGESVSLLFQVAKGSANPEKERQNIQWSILTNNYWKPLNDGFLLEDSTNQLLRSGIVRFNIPSDINLENSILERDFIWIKASVQENTDAVCDVINMHPQSVTAKFVDQGNEHSHLTNSLPAESISKLQTAFNKIKKTQQPYVSFNGMPKEQQEDFYTRVSERLRHKNRAITIWDYERLVLQEFPNIYKAKCLNHSNETAELAPGNVTMVLIPELSNQNAVNRLEPKVDLDTISRVGDFLKPRATFFNNIIVQNPEYEQVQVSCLVRFKQAFEFGFYRDVLNEELLKFLSPWTAEDKPEINFGGQLSKSEVLFFIENLEFVDFVTEIKLFHFEEDKISNDLDLVETSNSRSILVSHPNHILNPVPENAKC